jgi:hypothetical protein
MVDTLECKIEFDQAEVEKWQQQVAERREKMFPQRNKKRSMTEAARMRPHVMERDIFRLKDHFVIEQNHAEASDDAKSRMGDFMESVATQRDFKAR